MDKNSTNIDSQDLSNSELIDNLNKDLQSNKLELSKKQLLDLQNKKSYETYNFIGLYHMSKKDFILAKKFFQEACNLNGEFNSNTLFNLGIVEYELGNKKEALNYLQKTLEIEDNQLITAFINKINNE